MVEEDDSSKMVTDTTEAVEVKSDKVVVPPLVGAARRLERLLAVDKVLDFYTNPCKVVRRWLGTSSGAAADATAADIQAAAYQLLDSSPSAATTVGRALLTAGYHPPAATTTTAAAEETTSAMETDEDSSQISKKEGDPSLVTTTYLTLASAREVESWLVSLAVRLLWKEGKHVQALDLAQKGIDILMRHLEVGSSMTSSSSSFFPLLARLYRWRSLVAESLPTTTIVTVASMAQAHNLATLRRDVDTQATLLNSMLRDLLRHSQVEQAQKFLSNSTFPEAASNNQLCRHLYYSGRIQALRLEYTSAFSNLSQCLRKAPTNTATGFRIAAQRLLVVVQLLMGEIPDRQSFLTKDCQTELKPYLSITEAVRRGDLAIFEQVVTEHATRLQKDQTFTLISRLAHQVVKAGLRKLHVSYSRLSLQDVADRLGLPSAKTAEYVVAKAVRDGVLDATIHHELGYVQSHDLVDVYATKEPAEAFHRRIAYCLTTHNDAVRGMRYPPDAYKKQLEASRGNRRKRSDDKTDEEKAKELEDELDEDY